MIHIFTGIKQSYGNVAEVFARGRFGGALVLDGDVVKLEQPIRLSEDVLSPAVFNKCLAAHHFKQQHLIWTLALNQQNVCARCGQHYSERVAEQPLCRTHRQMIDRSTSPGVYRCCGELDHEHYVGCGNNAKHCRLYDLSGVDPSTEKSMIDPRQLRVPYANLDALATAGDGSW